MESIDSYVQRKNKQMEVVRNSVKELKVTTSILDICVPEALLRNCLLMSSSKGFTVVCLFSWFQTLSEKTLMKSVESKVGLWILYQRTCGNIWHFVKSDLYCL